MSEGGYMRLSIRCPHCLGKSAAEDHEELSRTVGEIAYRCRNYRCGHVFAARLEVVRTLEPSRTPSPLVALPVSAHVRRAPVQAALLASECDADDEADYLAELARPLADWPAAPSMGGALWGTAADAEADDAAERSRYRYITIRCPHCQAGAIAVASRELSRTLREVTYRCRNHRCRHAYVAQLEVVRTLSLSSLPCAEVVLPLSPHVRLGQLQALLQASAQAPPG